MIGRTRGVCYGTCSGRIISSQCICRCKCSKQQHNAKKRPSHSTGCQSHFSKEISHFLLFLHATFHFLNVQCRKFYIGSTSKKIIYFLHFFCLTNFGANSWLLCQQFGQVFALIVITNNKKLENWHFYTKINVSDGQSIAVASAAEESPDCVGQHTG